MHIKIEGEVKWHLEVVVSFEGWLVGTLTSEELASEASLSDVEVVLDSVEEVGFGCADVLDRDEAELAAPSGVGFSVGDGFNGVSVLDDAEELAEPEVVEAGSDEADSEEMGTVDAPVVSSFEFARDEDWDLSVSLFWVVVSEVLFPAAKTTNIRANIRPILVSFILLDTKKNSNKRHNTSVFMQV